MDKAVMNVFRMFGLMGGERVRVSSDGAAKLDDVLAGGVRWAPDVNGLAAREKSHAAILLWNYHDDDVEVPPSPIQVRVDGFPNDVKAVLVREYRIDNEHSNAFSAWKKIGAPQTPTAEQFKQLEAAGQLALYDSPGWFRADSGVVTLRLDFPRQAVALLELEW